MSSGPGTRPAVAVVMPFAGTRGEALAAIGALRALTARSGDERWLADNSGALADGSGTVADLGGAPAGSATAAGSAGDGAVRIVAAGGERSPAHARNAGAAAVGDGPEWILFLDADIVAPADLIDRYFAGDPIGESVGAVAGAIVARPPGRRAGVAARYGAYKNFLDAGAHLAHPFMPRAAAANLLVRRAAFEQLGGFLEGLRAAEDTDFCWRLQRAGWTLAACPGAVVEHEYRDSLAALRRQWRSYAAGRAWLARRYDGFRPEPALARGARRLTRRARPARAGEPAAWRLTRYRRSVRANDPVARNLDGSGLVTFRSGDRRIDQSPARRPSAAPRPPAPPGPSAPPQRSALPPLQSTPRPPGPLDRVMFAALDAILGVEELVGFRLSNRPPGADPAADGQASARSTGAGADTTDNAP